MKEPDEKGERWAVVVPAASECRYIADHLRRGTFRL
jgi:hypothetical protein